MNVVEELFQVEKAVIGVVHLPPLPGSPKYDGEDVSFIIESALRDARTLRDGGVDGVIIENFWDMPYRRCSVGPSTVASMAVIAKEVAREIDIPVGVNVLRNDVVAALAIAKVAGGSFIRVNAYVEVIVTDQGVLEPCARRVQMAKKVYRAESIKIFADVHVKHGAPLVQRPIEIVAEEALSRGLADAIILTGPSIGTPPSLEEVRKVRAKLPEASIIIGSGCNPENIDELFKLADAAIVGSYFKRGNLSSPISKEKVEVFMSKVSEIRRRIS
ncbi:MAG: BtpA/SgcQ family protein [Candidatus Nezhaarchaeales archaeon]